MSVLHILSCGMHTLTIGACGRQQSVLRNRLRGQLWLVPLPRVERPDAHHAIEDEVVYLGTDEDSVDAHTIPVIHCTNAYTLKYVTQPKCTLQICYTTAFACQRITQSLLTLA